MQNGLHHAQRLVVRGRPLADLVNTQVEEEVVNVEEEARQVNSLRRQRGGRKEEKEKLSAI